MNQECIENIIQREEKPVEAVKEAEGSTSSSAKTNEGTLERLIRAAYSGGQKGEAEVLFLLGEIYAQGLSKDCKKASGYYAEAMNKKHVEAHFKLGLLYESGCGVEQSDSLALRRFKKAAELGHTEAQFRLGKMYVEGHVVVVNKPQGCKLLYEAAQKGHAEAAQLYAKTHKEVLKKHFSAAVTPEDEKLWADLKEPANKKKTELFAQWGWQEPTDEKKLKKWYIKVVQGLTKKAEEGDINAQWQLAEMYREGLGVPRNHETAQARYKKVADAYMHSPQPRDAETNCRLGEMFLKGRGVEKNRSEAMEWYKKAAAQGHAHAQYHVGKMYAGGEYGPGKISKAIKWYTKAALQGHPKAHFYLKKMSLTQYRGAKLAKAALAEIAQAKAFAEKKVK